MKKSITYIENGITKEVKESTSNNFRDQVITPLATIQEMVWSKSPKNYIEVMNAFSKKKVVLCEE